jgi:hypothetical protein
MKNRSSIFIVPIIILAAFGWWDHRKLIVLHEMRDQLNARVEKPGISIENGRFTKRTRPDRDAEAGTAAAAFINHHKAREAVKRAGGDPEHSPETAANAPSEWMPLLDSKQVRLVIQEILSDSELDPLSRRLLIGQAVAFFPAEDPTGKLSLFSEFSLHLKDTNLGWKIVRESLTTLSEENPQAALNWAQNHKDRILDILKHSQDVLIRCTTGLDPALAFEVIREFGPERYPGETEASRLSTPNPEARTMALTAFRQHLIALNDQNLIRRVEERAWSGLAQGIVGEGFESGSKWLTAANPTPAELSRILQEIGGGLAKSKKMDQSANWVGWIANTLPAEESEKPIIGIVKSWTRYDHEAVGKWLVSAPEDLVKNAAIRGYAEAVFGHDPKTAAQWILTLPPGKDRDMTLENFYNYWPKDDPVGKEAFGNEHGIK